MEDFLADVGSKLGTMTFFLAAFLAVIAGVLFIAERSPKSIGNGCRSRSSPALPWSCSLIFLVYPALRTAWLSLLDKQGEAFVGLTNYVWIFTDRSRHHDPQHPDLGGAHAAAVHRHRPAVRHPHRPLADESVAKSLLFMPVSISFVGAGIIWKFVYAQRPDRRADRLLNQVLIWLGANAHLPERAPGDTLFLIVVMIWIQAGFAMVLLSAAIKAIPADIVEAARLDGVNAWQMFRSVTDPLDPAHAGGRAHDDHHRRPQGVRHRPHHDRWSVRHLGRGERDVRPVLPLR